MHIPLRILPTVPYPCSLPYVITPSIDSLVFTLETYLLAFPIFFSGTQVLGKPLKTIILSTIADCMWSLMEASMVYFIWINLRCVTHWVFPILASLQVALNTFTFSSESIPVSFMSPSYSPLISSFNIIMIFTYASRSTMPSCSEKMKVWVPHLVTPIFPMQHKCNSEEKII